MINKNNNQLELTKKLGNILKFSYDLEIVNYNAKNNLKELISLSEELYNDQINSISDSIAQGHFKIILIAGPSSAGKTTSSIKLQKTLKKKGLKAQIVSMDNFLINKLDTPLLEDGEYDFENVTTVDLGEFNKFIDNIIKLGKADCPIYSFIEDKRVGFEKIELQKNELLIIEGLHALNPIFTEGFASKNFFKIYVDVSSNFVIGKNVIINNKQLRLIRRMLRDYYKRGTSVEETMRTWKNVCRGEDDFIAKFKASVNCILNTTHMYEPLLYDNYLLPLLKTAQETPEINELIEVFNNTGTIQKTCVPKNSLIWEFLPIK